MFLCVGAWVAGGTGSHASHLLLTRAEGDGLLLRHQVLLLQVPRLLPLAGPALVLHLSMQPRTHVNTNYWLARLGQGGNSKLSSCCSHTSHYSYVRNLHMLFFQLYRPTVLSRITTPSLHTIAPDEHACRLAWTSSIPNNNL